MTNQAVADEDFLTFRDFMKVSSGIVLGDNKKYLVKNRLSKLMDKFCVPSFDALMGHVKSDELFREHIMDAMTTTETTWFRDIAPFEILKEKLLPEIAVMQPQEIHIWSAGCSTGQEPYSISMSVQEYLRHKPGVLPPGAVQILGTELSPKLLNIAEKGIFEQIDPASGLSATRKESYFTQVEGGWEVTQEVRSRVRFRLADLRKNFASLGVFDIIYCRNVLIYFSSDIKRDMLSRMARALKPGGYLIMGASESISDISQEFTPVRWRDMEVYRLKG